MVIKDQAESIRDKATVGQCDQCAQCPDCNCPQDGDCLEG